MDKFRACTTIIELKCDLNMIMYPVFKLVCLPADNNFYQSVTSNRSSRTPMPDLAVATALFRSLDRINAACPT